MAHYVLMQADHVRTVDGWDEVGKALRDNPGESITVWMLDHTQHVMTRVDVKAVRVKLMAQTYVIGDNEPIIKEPFV